MKKKDVFRNDARLDVAGVAFTAGAILAAVLFTFAMPDASADRNKSKKSSGVDAISLAKKFKGNLPITQLTEDQAITHALNRLAYGPRPGEVALVRQMGLEEWIDQQLDPDSIDDSALNARLEKYPTLRMSSKQLLDQFPQPTKPAKQKSETRREFKGRQQEERRKPVAQGMDTGKENTDQ